MQKMKDHLLRTIFLGLLFLLPSSLFAGAVPVKDFDRPRLIEAAQLQGLLSHPSVRIIDMRSSLSDYLKGHLPNAVYFHYEVLRVPEGGIPAQAPGQITLERLLGENLSVTPTMWVVLYSEKSNPNATYLAWILELLGHGRVGVLNGGWESWVSENHPTTREYPVLLPKKYFGKGIQGVLAEKKWIRGHLSSKDVVIVDARSPKQYSGEEGEEIRRGHIPGARNLPWEATLEGDEIKRWKKKEDLEKLVSELGMTRGKEIVIYGLTVREASHVFFTLKHVLGFPRVRLYRGSWVAWSADRNLPVKSGVEP